MSHLMDDLLSHQSHNYSFIPLKSGGYHMNAETIRDRLARIKRAKEDIYKDEFVSLTLSLNFSCFES